jgi:predicted ATPase
VTPPLIRSIRLDGFLSFAPGSEPVELRPLNVLIGPNGSGKSNFLEAFYLLAQLPHGDRFQAALRAGGGASEWMWKGLLEHGWPHPAACFGEKSGDTAHSGSG